MSDVYYHAYWSQSELGIFVACEEWYPIHTSPCFAYCVRGWTRRLMVTYATSHDTSALQAAKRLGIKVRRIDKTNSRYAFSSRQRAIEHMVFRQRKRLQHLRRDTIMVEKLIQNLVVDDAASELEHKVIHHVPNTSDTVNSLFRFD